jgi:hypothetical protein
MLKKPVFSVLLVLLTSACSSMLPKAHNESTAFQSFDEARLAVESLVPMTTDRLTLEKRGFSPTTPPNTKILTHSDVVRLFVPTTLLKREDLDPGVLVCLVSRDACQGLEITASKIARVRTGSFFTDFTNFKRRTETSGWRFNAMILLVNNLVVYRSWGGQPLVSEIELTSNPLGPFQDIGPAMLNAH